jgi:hypothetical protein
MNLEALNQFNKREFNRLFGLYVKRQKQALDISSEQLSSLTGLPLKEIKLIESGRRRLSQSHFEIVVLALQMDPDEILSLSKITQVENILDFLREIDGFYSR